MGILNRLFGGKKDGDFCPTTDAMPDDQFWNIIHVSYKKANGDYEIQQQMLDKELRINNHASVAIFLNSLGISTLGLLVFIFIFFT